MPDLFHIDFRMSAKEIELRKCDLVALKRGLCDQQLEQAIQKAVMREYRSHKVITREWKEQKAEFETRYSKLAYLALTNPADVTSFDDLLWFKSNAPIGTIQEISGKCFKRIGKKEPLWRLYLGTVTKEMGIKFTPKSALDSKEQKTVNQALNKAKVEHPEDYLVGLRRQQAVSIAHKAAPEPNVLVDYWVDPSE